MGLLVVERIHGRTGRTGPEEDRSWRLLQRDQQQRGWQRNNQPKEKRDERRAIEKCSRGRTGEPEGSESGRETFFLWRRQRIGSKGEEDDSRLKSVKGEAVRTETATADDSAVS